MDRYEALVAALRREIPGFQIVRKDRSRLHRAIHFALTIITFGKMRSYLDSYQTTLGRTVYVTSDWDAWDGDRRYVTLRHVRSTSAYFYFADPPAASRIMSLSRFSETSFSC